MTLPQMLHKVHLQVQIKTSHLKLEKPSNKEYGISSEVKAQASRISKLEDYRRFEDEYASNLRVLRAKFGRVHGSVDNFAKLQANALKGLRDDTK